MTVSIHQGRHTYQEYLALESFSPIKHEFLDGEIYAMAGGTPEHAALAAACIGLLLNKLRGGPCRPYTSDLRIHTRSGLATYPDVSVICGSPQLDPTDQVSATNPTLIVEVLSRSTEEWDRGKKFEHYKTLPSLRQYILVSTRERALEVWTREASGAWQAAAVRDGEFAELALGPTLDVRELYDLAGVLPAR